MRTDGRARPRWAVPIWLVLALATAAPDRAAARDDPAARNNTAVQDDRAAADRRPLPGIDGEPLTVTDLEQGTTLLVVWASWSPRCRGVAARIDRLAATWSDQARVASVVFQEDPETVREVVARHRLDAPVYLDLTGDFSQRHAVTTLPMLLIFRAGELVFRGKLSANPDTVIERIIAAS